MGQAAGAIAPRVSGRGAPPADHRISAGLVQLRFPLALLLVAQALDVWTTHAVLGLGGVEANPISALLLATGGFLGLAAAKVGVCCVAVAACVALVRRGSGHRARVALCSVCWFYAVVVSWNAWNVHLVTRA
jgi:hypothetical protein